MIHRDTLFRITVVNLPKGVIVNNAVGILRHVESRLELIPGVLGKLSHRPLGIDMSLDQ
jgi:hypothetical protein